MINIFGNSRSFSFKTLPYFSSVMAWMLQNHPFHPQSCRLQLGWPHSPNASTHAFAIFAQSQFILISMLLLILKCTTCFCICSTCSFPILLPGADEQCEGECQCGENCQTEYFQSCHFNSKGTMHKCGFDQSLVSKHLRGRIGTCVGHRMFFNQDLVGDVTFFNQRWNS